MSRAEAEIVLILASVALAGAPLVIPTLPTIVGHILFWAGVAGLLGWAMWRIGRGLGWWSASRPDYAAWDKRFEFRLWETACLWSDIEPTQPLPWRARRQLRKLSTAIEAGKLPVAQPSKREFVYAISDKRRHGKAMKVNPDWLVTRDALRSHAEEIDERPRFLFRSERIR